MSNSFRRYEILLPRWFNDEQSVLDELLVEVLRELEQQVGAASPESRLIRGFWHHQSRSFPGEMARVFLTLEVVELPATQQFFRDFKERLKARFHPSDIWMTSHPIEVI